MPRSAFNEGVVLFAHRRDGSIHELSNAVGGVTSEKLAEGAAVDLAARCSEPLRELFGLRKHFVRDGYGNFHTSSITVHRRDCQPGGIRCAGRLTANTMKTANQAEPAGISGNADCKHKPGVFRPIVDRNACEGKGDCVRVCPVSVFAVDTLPREERRGLSLKGRLKGFAHRWQQALLVNPDACEACGLCVEACPERALTLVRA